MPGCPDISESERLVQSLMRRSSWPRDVSTRSDIELIETQISWVLLTDEFAWKIKKPVRFDFADFSTLERRRHYCERELELNRQFSPELYVDVVAIHGTPEKPRLRFGVERSTEMTTDSQSAGTQAASERPRSSPPEEPFEFVVRMRHFDQDQILNRLATEGRLDTSLVDSLADRIAGAHLTAERLSDVSVALQMPAASRRPANDERIERLCDAAHDNFEALKRRLDRTAQLELAARLERWSDAELHCLKDMLANRRRSGLVRRCHGDLHLGNIVLIDGRLCLFDCIEFNEDFRWIDVMSEVAFVMMDLDEHDLPRLAWRFLNRYLERTGDYEGVLVLPFFLVYRAMVRAKVDAIRLEESAVDPQRYRRIRGELQGCLKVADNEHNFVVPTLILMRGVSGSGKTFVSQLLIERLSGIRVRSDVERKRLAGLIGKERPGVGRPQNLYSEPASQETYDRLLYLADTLILSGHPVIVDATFLTARSRQPFLELASCHNASVVIVNCHAPPGRVRKRPGKRSAQGDDASDADEELLTQQRSRVETPGAVSVEQADGIRMLDVDTSLPASIDAAIAMIRDALTPLDEPVPAIAHGTFPAREY